MKTKLLTLLPTLTALASFGQVKIGTITIDSATAQRYFLDCYQHPDTITREYVDGCGEQMQKEVKLYNEWLSGIAIKHIVAEIKHPAEIDTVKTSWMMGSGSMHTCPFGSIKHEVPYYSPIKHKPVVGYKGHEKDFMIINNPEWIEKVELGFSVPRKPSEIDFIKWTVKNKSLSK